MKMTNYVPPRPYAGINKSDRRRWTSTILGAVLVLAVFAVMIFLWWSIEVREDPAAGQLDRWPGGATGHEGGIEMITTKLTILRVTCGACSDGRFLLTNISKLACDACGKVADRVTYDDVGTPAREVLK